MPFRARLWMRSLAIGALLALCITPAIAVFPARIRAANFAVTGGLALEFAGAAPLNISRGGQASVPIQITINRSDFSSLYLSAWFTKSGVYDMDSLPASDGIIDSLLPLNGTSIQPMDIVGNFAAGTLADYQLIACGRYELTFTCTAPLNLVEAPSGQPPTRPSTSDLVRAAVKSGRLSPDDAAQDDLWALVQNPHLPLDYQSDDPEPDVDSIDADVAASSSSMQEAAQPYMIPPFVAGSWWDTEHNIEPSVTKDFSPICGRPPSSDWGSVERASNDSKVKVWYQEGAKSSRVQLATDLATYADTVLWPKYQALLGIVPISDGGGPCRGGDDKLDISLVENLGDSFTQPYFGYLASCSHVPVYINMDTGVGLHTGNPTVDEAPLKFTLAHELFHAFQYALSYDSSCSDYTWLKEGSAIWAASTVTPDFQLNNSHPDYSICSWEHNGVWKAPLNDAQDTTKYRSFLFDAWASRKIRPDFVATALRNSATTDSLTAADMAIGHGLLLDPQHRRDLWIEFFDDLYNYAPWNDFERWYGDNCTVLSENLPTITPGNDLTLPLSAAHLSGDFQSFVLGPGVTAIRSDNAIPPTLAGWPEFRSTWQYGPNNTNNWTYELAASNANCFYLEPGPRKYTQILANPQPLEDIKPSAPTVIEASGTSCSNRTGTATAIKKIVADDGRMTTATVQATITWPGSQDLDRAEPIFGFNNPGSNVDLTANIDTYIPTSLSPACGSYHTHYGPIIYQASKSDGLLLGMFKSDDNPPFGSYYVAGDTALDWPLSDPQCWDPPGDHFAIEPWLVMPGAESIAGDGSQIAGSYSMQPIRTSDHTTTYYSWSWNLQAPSSGEAPVYPDLQAPAMTLPLIRNVPKGVHKPDICGVGPCGIPLPRTRS